MERKKSTKFKFHRRDNYIKSIKVVFSHNSKKLDVVFCCSLKKEMKINYIEKRSPYRSMFSDFKQKWIVHFKNINMFKIEYSYQLIYYFLCVSFNYSYRQSRHWLWFHTNLTKYFHFNFSYTRVLKAIDVSTVLGN